MRSSILLLVLSTAVLGSCTSAYKTGQTPDDVYYSPARQQDEYVNVKENDDRRYQGNDEYYDDQYLRMKVHNIIITIPIVHIWLCHLNQQPPIIIREYST